MWFSVWSVIAAIAPNPWMLVGTRFMAGMGIGAEITAVGVTTGLVIVYLA